ncbi:MAG: hypothetical protein IJS88_01835 [Alphaproteobacteria bacterium]|nr:hypothetical protein [Alphaproteobacteria bacterium]
MKKAFIWFIFGLCGCVTPLKIPPKFKPTLITTPDFDFAVWQKIEQPAAPYKIYIEGDGYAFNSRGIPTSNPTPRGTFMRSVAFGDSHPNVVYMARACQFVQNKKCEQKYWTDGRFAPEIITAQSDAIKQIIRGNSVTLIGFSGGAQIAGLVAVTHPEIKVSKIITIGGNLDHPAWTAHHRVPPLENSADLNDYRDKFAQIAQIHYVGSDDMVMPPFLNENFAADKQTVIVVEGATHNSGWDKVVPQIRASD